MSRILVVGANGTVGSELSRLLAAQGESVVKATSRTATAADQVTVDVVTPSRVARCVAAMPRPSRIALIQPEGGRGGRSALRQAANAVSSCRSLSSEKLLFIFAP